MSPRWPISIVALPPVKCGAVLWRMGGVQRVTIAVKASFGMVHEGAARVVGAEDVLAEDHVREPMSGALDEASDLAPYLPTAGVVLTGHAFAPGGRPTSGMAVRLAVFRDERALLDKTLHVFGYRALVAGAAPQPFQKIPLSWDRAFGGPSTEDNPAGSGAIGSRSLPNILDPRDAARPAGFGPVARAWGPRRRLLGGADPAALSRAPLEIPEGFDFRWFHAAPVDQQIELLRGDEWIVLEGLHPALPGVQTRLPPVRAEARLYAGGAALPTPIDLSADTLIIDADRQICSLVFRGHFTAEADALPRVIVHAGLSMLGRPITWPDHEAAPVDIAPARRGSSPPAPAAAVHLPRFHDDDDDDLAAATRAISIKGLPMPALPFKQPQHATVPAPSAPPRPDDGVLPFRAPALPFTPPLEPPAPPAVEPSPRPPVAAPPVAAPVLLLAEDQLEEHTSAIDLRAARPIAPFAVAEPGTRTPVPPVPLPGAPWGPPITPLAPPLVADEPTTAVDPVDLSDFAPPRLADIDAALAAAHPAAGPRAGVDGGAGVEPRANVPSLVDASDFALTAIDLEPPPIALTAPSSRPLPAPSLRDKVVARLASGEGVAGLDLARADLSGVDFSRAILSNARLGGAKLEGCSFAHARLADADLGEADLTGADLGGADLSRADLTRAVLARARFDGANLGDARLTSARGPGASFADAVARRASFARGAWEGAIFDRLDGTSVDFSAAALGGASFRDASLASVRLEGAQGSAAVFDGARMPAARADGASFTGCSFARIDAKGSIWEQATLDGSRFDGAELEDASFIGAACARASFARAHARNGNFERLVGESADFSGADLEDSNLRQARLADADLRGAVLRGITANRVDLSRARLTGADLDSAVLRGGKLTGAVLARATLEGADLRDADLERANLFEAQRKTAKLSGANLKGTVEVDPEV